MRKMKSIYIKCIYEYKYMKKMKNVVYVLSKNGTFYLNNILFTFFFSILYLYLNSTFSEE